MEKELQLYKDLDVLRSPTVKDSVYFVYSSAAQKVTQIWVTTNKNVPKQVELFAPITLKTITSPSGTIEVIETSSEIQLELEASILSLINSSLQAGDNISSLTNDAGYIAIGDIPPFVPSDYDLEEFDNNGIDPYVRQSEITSGITNLSYTSSPTQGTVNSDTGNDAIIPQADLTNAGLLVPADKNKLNNTSGINSGDQTSIVGITGTKAQLNTAVTDGDILFVGDVVSYTNEEAQDAVGAILLGTSTIDLSYNDATPSISADVKANSIDANHLSDSINVSEFVNDSGYSTITYADGKVIDSIANADTTHAPSRNSVFDALLLKEDTANKSTSTADSASSVKFPVWSAILNYFSASSIRSILGITTLSGTNTGDETTATLKSKINEELAYACSDETSSLTVGIVITFRMPFAFTLSSIRISVNTAPTISSLIVDVKESGTSIFSTLLSIDAAEKTSVTAALPAVISDVNLADDAEMAVSITQIGSGVAGAGLKILFIGKKA